MYTADSPFPASHPPTPHGDPLRPQVRPHTTNISNLGRRIKDALELLKPLKPRPKRRRARKTKTPRDFAADTAREYNAQSKAIPRGNIPGPAAVYRVSGRRGPVQVSRDVTARGKGAAVRVFADATGADHVDSVRKLRRDPAIKAARRRNGIAERSSKIRRQLSAAETRTLHKSLPRCSCEKLSYNCAFPIGDRWHCTRCKLPISG